MMQCVGITMTTHMVPHPSVKTPCVQIALVRDQIDHVNKTRKTSFVPSAVVSWLTQAILDAEATRARAKKENELLALDIAELRATFAKLQTAEPERSATFSTNVNELTRQWHNAVCD
eukprot:m.228783 g.228783  ORF g.228783 m.228783 type:complete len:117 (+) comp18832_c1_seq8:167-517(+)